MEIFGLFQCGFTSQKRKMAQIFVQVVAILCLGWWWWATTVDAEYLKYKDPKQPVAVRVMDLLGRMTLEEKIGQMVQIDRSVANVTVMKDYSIGKAIVSLSVLCKCSSFYLKFWSSIVQSRVWRFFFPPHFYIWFLWLKVGMANKFLSPLCR